MFFFLCFLSGESGHLQKRFVLPSPVPIRISLTFHWLELGHCSSLSQSQVKGVTLLVLLLDHPSCSDVPSTFLEAQDCTEEQTLDRNPDSTRQEVGSKGNPQSSLSFPFGALFLQQLS